MKTITPALVVSDLTKTYKNGFQALKGIDLAVQQGDFFALLGPNGAGKSTTIGIISSLVNKTSGTVTVFDQDIDINLAAAKARLGLVPQEINFNPFEPVLKILLNQAGYYGVPRKVAMHRAEKHLKQMGLWEKRYGPARNLSGGMKRRLMIARALMHEPCLLILDEPTAGVDVELRYSMWEFLRELNAQGVTIILTTHYLEEAEQLCRNIAIIDQGCIVENANMKELLNRLQTYTVVLDLVNPLTQLPILKDYQLRRLDEITLEVEIEKGRDLNGLFTQLSSLDIAVASMRNKTNRLEELFMRLVGEKDDI